MAVILAGMGVAFGMILHRLPPTVSFLQAVSVAGKDGETATRSIFPSISSGATPFGRACSAASFLALSYFGTDQSQVQRYLAGGSLAGSRFGLLFNAVLKLPMQFFILFTGVMVFIFFQFEKPPIFFNQPAYQRAAQSEQAGKLATLQTRYDQVFARKAGRRPWPNDCAGVRVPRRRLMPRRTPSCDHKERSRRFAAK